MSKTLDRPVVEFFATSPRLVHAYRTAARRKKSLTRRAAFHELGHATMGRRAEQLQNLQVVVLSHADDDHSALTDERLAPVVSGAFHLLFTEPDTHPDQVAQWMRTTKIQA